MSEVFGVTGNNTGRQYYYQNVHDHDVCGTCGCIVDRDYLQIHTDWHDNGNA